MNIRDLPISKWLKETKNTVFSLCLTCSQITSPLCLYRQVLSRCGLHELQIQTIFGLPTPVRGAGATLLSPPTASLEVLLLWHLLSPDYSLGPRVPMVLLVSPLSPRWECQATWLTDIPKGERYLVVETSHTSLSDTRQCQRPLAE